MRSRFPFVVMNVSWRWQVLVGAVVGLCLGGTAACRNAPPPPEPTEESTAVSPTAPPPPPSSAFLGLLAPEQTAQINALGLPLVLPTTVPAGFSATQVQPQPDERFAGYQILYRDSSDRCFLIEYTVGGLEGTPATAERRVLNPPMVAENSVEYALNYGPYTDLALREQFSEPALVSDWLPVAEGFARLAGAALINNTLSPPVPCTDLTVEEAVAIVESLAVISDEIQGDKAPE